MRNVLIVHAHPEERSLTSALKDHAQAFLRDQGYAVQTSDLYQMGWKAVADAEDFTDRQGEDRLYYVDESRRAYKEKTQSKDIEAEQDKLLWADGVILTFPLWWYGMPAIMKGWVDRVFACGFAYGVGTHGNGKWGDRYGQGTLAGKRALIAVSIGGLEPHYGERGVNGRLQDVLWPITHGMLFYTGMSVLPPFPLYNTKRLLQDDWAKIAAEWETRLAGMFDDDVIPFRAQNGGHYDQNQVLKPEFGKNLVGNDLHLLAPDDPAQKF